MTDTSEMLRNRIALYRTLLAEGVDLNVTRHYLNKIVMAEMQLREIESQKNEKSRSVG
jgi:hypothetical protein